jgi:hypothetical protein
MILGCDKGTEKTITALCVGKHPDLSTLRGCFLPQVDKSGCFPTQRAVIVNFGKTSQLFYYHMTNLIQSKSII